MRSTLRLFPLLALIAALAFKLGAWRPAAIAEAVAAPPQVNACGCYRDSAGSCYCGKKAGKCACPGECEPKGCDEKRAKELDKEIEAEAKRAREADKKQQEEQAERRRKEEAPPPPAPEEQAGDDQSGAASASDDDEDEDDKAAKRKLKKKTKATNKAEKPGEKASKKEPASTGANG